jgi:hypothetical protein
MENNINKLLYDLVSDPYNPVINLKLGYEYELENQIASAVSYYLRSAEFSTDPNISYESLIRIGLCLGKADKRAYSEKGAFLNATQCIPNRPEAYFYLSQYEEYRKNWQEAYSYANIGYELCEYTYPDFILPHKFPGKLGNLFQKALCSWWMGLCDESREMFQKLKNEYSLVEPYKSLIQNNLIRLGLRDPFLPYTRIQKNKLKTPFDGIDLVERNYSQTYQDMFILTMLNGKKNGTYLEIGSADPYYGSNTALLESIFNWTGVSIDIKKEEVDKFNAVRKNKAIQRDALTINYSELLSKSFTTTDIDYLQLDCEPPSNTFQILLSIPFEKYRFAVITYEHDHYVDVSDSYRDKSRRYLVSMGYIPVATNISPDNNSPYEDWWIHPELVSPEIIEKMKAIGPEIKKADLYMFGEYNKAK